MNANPTMELITTIEVGKSMNLIDINGKKVNFQSECIVSSTSDEPFQIAIVNQNDLDNGTVKFEICNGKETFSRRVTYESEENEHVNHYIAFKKMKSTDEKTVIKPNVIVRLKELKKEKMPLQNEPIMSTIQYPSLSSSSSQNLSDQIDLSEVEVEVLKTKLHELSLSNGYNNQNSLYRNIAIGCFFIVILVVILKK